MTDEEKIEQDRQKLRDLFSARDFLLGEKLRFIEGIQWRDENPPDKVLALVEALKKIQLEAIDDCHDLAREALAAWDCHGVGITGDIDQENTSKIHGRENE